MRNKIVLEDEDGEAVEIPTKMEVCGRCEGAGIHDHPAFSNGISSDEWNGPDWDDDSREGYLSGRYDVPCSECNGLRIVPVPDKDRLTPKMRELLEEREQYEAEMRAEQRMRDRGIEF